MGLFRHEDTGGRAGVTTKANASGHSSADHGHPILTPFKHLVAPQGVTPALRPRDSSSPWTTLVNPPPFGTPGTMLLESDGAVLVHNEPDNNTTGGTNDWWKLTPDASGSYADGTWSQIASMPAAYTPLYFASAILPDGRMIVEGGEYIGENAAWSNQGAIYNPVANSWASVPPPRGWTNMGDAASDVLADGTFMLQQPCNTCLTNPDLTVDDALLNAKNLTWRVIPATGKTDPNDEEGWTLEPSGQVLTVDVWAAIGGSQLFNPNNDTWTFSGAEAPGGNPLNPWPVVEIGPQAEVPGGNMFVVGAGTSAHEPPTPCTDDQAGRHRALHVQDRHVDRRARDPAHRQPGVRKHRRAGVGPAGWERTVRRERVPVQHADSLLRLRPQLERADPDPGRAERAERPNDTSYQTRMLALPNGQILYNDGSDQMEVHTAGGSPNPAWAPSITSLSNTDSRPRWHLQPVRQAARRARPGSRHTVTTSRTTPTSPWCGSPTTRPA